MKYLKKSKKLVLNFIQFDSMVEIFWYSFLSYMSYRLNIFLKFKKLLCYTQRNNSLNIYVVPLHFVVFVTCGIIRYVGSTVWFKYIRNIYKVILKFTVTVLLHIILYFLNFYFKRFTAVCTSERWLKTRPISAAWRPMGKILNALSKVMLVLFVHCKSDIEGVDMKD